MYLLQSVCEKGSIMGKFVPVMVNVILQIQDESVKNRLLKLIDTVEEIGVNYPEGWAKALVIDSKSVLSGSAQSADLIEDADYCICIVSHEDEESIEWLLNQGVHFTLRESHHPQEFIHMLRAVRTIVKSQFQNQILENIYDSAHNSIVITNKEGVIQYANQYFLEATGYKGKDLIGELPKKIKSGMHSVAFYEELWQVISSGNVWRGFFINKSLNGGLFYEEATISPIFNTKREIINYLKIGKCVERELLLTDSLNSEMIQAKELLSGMLPIFYKDQHLQFDSKMKAYNYLGGDFISFDKLEEGRYVLAIIDVMGHGASSTLVGLKSMTQFRTHCQYKPFSEAVVEVNKAIAIMNQDEFMTSRYLTGVFIELDLNTGILKYINAGHPEFYLYFQDGCVQSIHSNNMLMGISEQFDFGTDEISIKGLSHIFLYSDGLTEIQMGKNTNAQPILMDVFNYAREHEKNRLLTAVLDEMIGCSEIKDDVTLCYLEVLEDQSRQIG